MNKRTSNTSWYIDISLLIFATFCLFFILLGTRALFTPDEGRYAEIAREMVMRNDFITPYLNSIKYFEKPALYYWLTAASIKIGGLSLWGVRSINALLAIFGVVMTYVTGRLIFNRLTGLLAALILPTTVLYFVMAHMISLDLPVTVFMGTSLYAFILGSRCQPGNTRRWLIWLCAAMSALAVLTKGLIGIVLPGLIIFLWLMMTGEWRNLKKYYIPSSLILFLIITTPWHAIVSMRNPEFFHFYFIEQHFLRYTTKDIGHYEPIWYFIPCLLAGFFPWIIFLPQALAHKIKDKRNLFFFLWAIVIFAFFSFSKSKLIPYILPIFPALAMLTGNYLAMANSRKQPYTWNYLALLIASLAITALFFWYVHTTSFPNKHLAAIYLALASVSLLASSVIALVLCRSKPIVSLSALILGIYLFSLLVLAAVPSIDNRTILPMIRVVNTVITPNDEVVTYNQYYQELPFYLERRITILNWRNEMSQGMQHQDTSEWMIDDAKFWQRWHSKKRIFVFMSKSEYQQLLHSQPDLEGYLITGTLNNVVISNKAK